MKNLFLKILLGALIGFSSFASAEVVKDVDLETIMEVINTPTKTIVDQKVGDTVIMYKWYKGNDFLEIPGEYGSYEGRVIQTGFESDRRGREYKYIIVYFKNHSSPGSGKYFKYVQYSPKKNTLVIMNGEFLGDPEDKEHSFFNLTPEKSWVDTKECHSMGGCGEKTKTAAI